MHDRPALPFPVVGEISDAIWDQVAGGQPMLLLHHGRPAAVIVDLDSWEEAEAATQPESCDEAGTAATQVA